VKTINVIFHVLFEGSSSGSVGESWIAERVHLYTTDNLGSLGLELGRIAGIGLLLAVFKTAALVVF
jgi:hypothetical protein